MGNIIRNNYEGLPRNYSYQKAKDLVFELNTLFKQNAKDLGFILGFKETQLQYNNHDWKQSVISGLLVKEKGQHSQRFNLKVNLKTIYKMHEAMKHFQKRLSQSKMMTTPSDFITPKDKEECCICLDKAPSMMLPCFHAYCIQCTQTHIIQKQQKKCPLCRAQFTEKSLNQKMITVVVDEKELISDLREILFGYLKEMNSCQVRSIEKDFRCSWRMVQK